MMKKRKLSLTVTVLVLLMLVFTSTCFAETDLTETTKTGIIGAMDEEVNKLKEALCDVEVAEYAAMSFYSGSWTLLSGNHPRRSLRCTTESEDGAGQLSDSTQ